MSHVLYRKYRSQTFDELIGQEHIAKILKNAVSQGQISHAYLFTGPRGLGKTSTARILAKAANCLELKNDGNPCGACKNCESIQEGKFLDLIEIDAASNRGIDQIRDLKEKIEFSPTEGKYKVYIIDEVHMLTTEAFNALLKTLEEPPKHAMFILCTTEVHKIPATIMSRCQRFDFRLGTEEEIILCLEQVANQEDIEVDDKAMNLIVDNARGSYRDALSLLDVVVSGQKESSDPKKVTEDEVRAVLGLADSTMVYFFLEKIVNGETSEALDLVDELNTKGVNLSQFIKFVLSVLREILVSGLRGKDDTEYSFAQKLDRQKTLKLINLFVDAEKSLKGAVVPTLPLEMLIADSISIFGTTDDAVVSSSGGDNSDSGDNSKDESKKKTKKTKKTKQSENPEKQTKNKGDSKSVKATAKKEKKTQSKKQKGKRGSVSLSMKELKKKWPKVLEQLKPFNSHLYAFIGRSKILELKNGVLRLAVGFDFHKDRLECKKSRDALADVFKDIFGAPVRLECKVDSSIREKIKPAADVVIVDEEKSDYKKGDDLVSDKDDGDSANIYDSIAEVFGDELMEAA